MGELFKLIFGFRRITEVLAGLICLGILIALFMMPWYSTSREYEGNISFHASSGDKYYSIACDYISPTGVTPCPVVVFLGGDRVDAGKPLAEAALTSERWRQQSWSEGSIEYKWEQMGADGKEQTLAMYSTLNGDLRTFSLRTQLPVTLEVKGKTITLPASAADLDAALGAPRSVTQRHKINGDIKVIK